MVILAGSTGLRRSEMIPLTWVDVNRETVEVNVLRSCVRSQFGENTTECSKRPVPLHPVVLNALLEWRDKSLDQEPTDFLFLAYLRLHGRNYKKWFNTNSRDERHPQRKLPRSMSPCDQWRRGLTMNPADNR